MLKIGAELLPSDTLPVLNMCVLEEIERAMKQTRKPHRLESSQNSEDTLKSLLKPVLHSLGWGNIVVTTSVFSLFPSLSALTHLFQFSGYSWREAISLRSSADDGNHEYSPKSDMAILDDHGEDTLETVLLLFEAYSEAGQKRSTPDEDRTDRVRLILQASHLARKYSRPSVALYLTRNNDMETITVFPNGGKSEGEVCFSDSAGNNGCIMMMMYRFQFTGVPVLLRKRALLFKSVVRQRSGAGNQPCVDTQSPTLNLVVQLPLSHSL